MKKIGLLLAFFVSSLLLPIQAQPIDREMFAKVVGMNHKRNCPYNEGWWMVNKLTYQPGYLIFHITLNDNFLTGCDSLELRAYFADRIRYRKEAVVYNYLLEKLGDIKGGFVYNVVKPGSKSVLSIKYSPAEARQIWADRTKPAYKNSEKWMKRQYFRQQIYYQEQDNTPITEEKPVRTDSIKISQDTIVWFQSVYPLIFTEFTNRFSFYKYNIEKQLLQDPNVLDEFITAEYSILYNLYKQHGNERIKFLIPLSRLKELRHNGLKPVLLDDEWMNLFMKEIAETFMSDEVRELYLSDTIKDIQASFQDSLLQIAVIVNENKIPFGSLSSEKVDVVKQYFASVCKSLWEDSSDTLEILDTVITCEAVFQRIKGMQILFIEENTHKTIDFFLTPEEIKAVKYQAEINDSITAERFAEQMLATSFAEEIEHYNQEMMPMTSGGIVIYKMNYDLENLHYFARIDSVRQLLSTDTNVLKESLRKQLQFALTQSNLYQQLEKVHSGLIYHYAIVETGDTLHIRFSAQEVADVVQEESKKETSNPMEALYPIIDATNKQCPMRIDDITMLDSIGLEGGKLVLYHSILRPGMVLSENVLRMVILSALQGNDNAMTDYLLRLCVQTNLRLCYRYIIPPMQTNGKKKAGKKGKPSVINTCFSADELQQILESK